MKTIFIDESGKGNQFFLLCGVIVDNDDLVSLNNSIFNFKFKHDLYHLKDLRKPRDRRNKIYLLKELSEILQLHDVKVISVILGDNTLIDINDLFRGKCKETQRRFESLKYVTERFYKHIDRNKTTGQVIFDSLDRETKKLISREFHSFITQKKSQIAFRDKYDFETSICSSMCFSNGNYNHILQISDLIGFALKIAFEISLEEKNFDELNPEILRSNLNYLDVYWPLFEKNHMGTVEGYGIKLWNYNIFRPNLSKDFCINKIERSILNEQSP